MFTKIPVTTLCGFLGAGKTTLLRHILEKKHNGGEFKCAVIVNDMAELNIDKSLIDKTSILQSEEVISMQNGCVCCTLQGDLVKQIVALAKTGKFNHMIIEASGVSEPAEIASLFAKCEDDHDHEKEHSESESLYEYAKIDTCVTVVDTYGFFNKFNSLEQDKANFQGVSQLLIEQIEYANVIILNKLDLVNDDQAEQVYNHVFALNPKARIIKCKNSNVDVNEVVGKNIYDEKDFELLPGDLTVEDEAEMEPECCARSKALGQVPCCRKARTTDTGKSKVVLGSSANQKTRHSSRFNIQSFTYAARRPFHPKRFHEDFIDKYFVFVERSEDGDDNKTPTLEDVKKAADQCSTRREEFGTICRSKGFLWMANAHDLMGCYGQAGNVVTIETPGTWYVLDERSYNGTEKEKQELRKDWVGPFGDRRQELVFIGIDLKHKTLQRLLDDCLLTDAELALGVDGWKAVFGDLMLDGADDNGSDAGDMDQS